MLPAHEYRFRDLRARVTSLIDHHEHRLAEFEAQVVARPGVTCWQLTEQSTWSRPWAQISGFMRRAANGETLAHLELLAAQGRVVRRHGPPTTWYPGSVSSVGPSTASVVAITPPPGCC